MSFEAWSAVIGALLVSIALAGPGLRRTPFTGTMFYFGVGLVLGPLGTGVVRIDPVEWAPLLERLAEIAVIVSLFTTGLKLRVPIRNPLWGPPLRLAFASMAITVALVAAALHYLANVPWGAAILIGAILAPTDPVLASEVQVQKPGDDDRLRFALTAEAGLNDGTAFPLVMLGLGLLGLHDLGAGAWRWWSIDVVWAIVAGLGLGALLGKLTGESLVRLGRRGPEGLGQDEFLTLGLIGLSYGLALLIGAYGFLAVFAAGLALRAVEHRYSTGASVSPATSPTATAQDSRQMVDSVLRFNEQLERLIEVGLVLCLGAMLTWSDVPSTSLWFIPLLLLVIRPIAVGLGLWRSSVPIRDRWVISWLGIRGIGSLYYLMFAVEFGLSDAFTRQLVSLVVVTVAVSIFVHGLTAPRLMSRSTG